MDGRGKVAEGVNMAGGVGSRDAEIAIASGGVTIAVGSLETCTAWFINGEGAVAMEVGLKVGGRGLSTVINMRTGARKCGGRMWRKVGRCKNGMSGRGRDVDGGVVNEDIGRGGVGKACAVYGADAEVRGGKLFIREVFGRVEKWNGRGGRSCRRVSRGQGRRLHIGRRLESGPTSM